MGIHQGETPAVQGLTLQEDTKQTDTVDCARDDATRKRLATLTARLALRGFALRQPPHGGFIVDRWDLARELVDLDAVAAFAERVGAKS